MFIATMIAVIPVKLSVRLPGKHFLKFGNETMIERIYRKVSSVTETVVYSKIDLPVPYMIDDSQDIMHLVIDLKAKYEGFVLIGGDMPFFTEDDVRKLLSSYNGTPVTPIDSDGNIEPLFSIYRGGLLKAKNMREALLTSDTKFIPKEQFSSLAFFNVNTFDEYLLALRILEEQQRESQPS